MKIKERLKLGVRLIQRLKEKRVRIVSPNDSPFILFLMSTKDLFSFLHLHLHLFSLHVLLFFFFLIYSLNFDNTCPSRRIDPFYIRLAFNTITIFEEFSIFIVSSLYFFFLFKLFFVFKLSSSVILFKPFLFNIYPPKWRAIGVTPKMLS